MKSFLERKIKYNSEIVDVRCKLLEMTDKGATLFHHIETSFTMIAGNIELTIPKGSYTTAYYWKNQPYNLYYWRDKDGQFLGAYFNIVKNTIIASNIVSFEDLIIDVLIFPNGDYYILDEDELPVPIEQFEAGSVKSALHALISRMNNILKEVELEVTSKYTHELLEKYLN